MIRHALVGFNDLGKIACQPGAAEGIETTMQTETSTRPDGAPRKAPRWISYIAPCDHRRFGSLRDIYRLG